MTRPDASSICTAIADAGVRVVSGVPCSLLAPLAEKVAADERFQFVPATSEGEAAAVAAGAWLGGSSGAALAQNSGLGNMVSPLSSLVQTHEIPITVVCSLRGDAPGDEPQHRLMGQITESLLDLLELPHRRISQLADASQVGEFVTRSLVEQQRSCALLVDTAIGEPGQRAMDAADSDVTTTSPAITDLRSAGKAFTRPEATRAITDSVGPDTLVISTAGYASRELHFTGDREQFFYQVGAMGYAGAVGLGAALAAGPELRVVVIDGDGSLLMHLGNLTTIGWLAPSNLLHVVLDNGMHESTGGQPTASRSCDIAAIAAASGYDAVSVCNDAQGLAQALGDRPADRLSAGPEMIHVLTAPCEQEARPRPLIDPRETARRVRKFALDASRVEVFA